MPPVTVKSIAPVDAPLHKKFVTVVDKFNAVGCVIVADVVEVHEFASVTVTVYVFAAMVFRSCVIAPLLQAYE